MQRLEHRILVFVHIVHRERIERGRKRLLHALDHAGEQLVGRTGDYGKDAVAIDLLEILGVFVALETVTLHGLEHLRARLVTDIRVVIQDAGDRADGIARLAGKILDGHISP